MDMWLLLKKEYSLWFNKTISAIAPTQWAVRYVLVTALPLTSYVTLDKSLDCSCSKFPFAYIDLFKLEAFQSSLWLPFSASFHQAQNISELSINQKFSTTTKLVYWSISSINHHLFLSFALLSHYPSAWSRTRVGWAMHNVQNVVPCL